jgi:hypothetical protein
MRDDVQLRFYLASKLHRMHYGQVDKLKGHNVESAWPPTGDYDKSDLGFFRAMSLAAGGNRPEESLTTMERIERDLDDSFHVEKNWDGDYVFRRRLADCPRCRGAGSYKRIPAAAYSLTAPVGAIPMDEVVTIEVVKCDHAPDE